MTKHFMVIRTSLVAGIHSFAKPFVKSAVSNSFFLSEQLLRTRFSVIIDTDLHRNNSSAWEANNHQLDNFYRMILIIWTIDYTRHFCLRSQLVRPQNGCILHRGIRCTLIRTSHCDVGVASTES